jgi:hypothetical protein
MLPAYDVAVHLSRNVGARVAGSAAERRAQRYVEGRMRRAGLRIASDRFTVFGRTLGDRPYAGSRNVIGVWDGAGRCLVVVMGHVDTVPGAPGAMDNGSGAGVVTALAARLPKLRPYCDVWAVATGAEERMYTGSPDHLGALALVRRVKREHRTRDLRIALSLDELGRQRRFWLRTPKPRPGRAARSVLAAGRRTGVTVQWVRDSATGNSDHRELALAGLPGAVLEAFNGGDACHHLPCDTWRRLRAPVLRAAQRVAEDVVSRAR